jgi:hypothetical protein
MEEPKKKEGNVIDQQLDTLAYLLELCYGRALAKRDNVSVSLGFEKCGLRVN